MRTGRTARSECAWVQGSHSSRGREGVTAFLIADQPLHDTGLDGSTPRSYFVLLKEFLGTGEALFAHQCGYGDFDPFFARALVAGGGAGRNHTPPKQGTDD